MQEKNIQTQPRKFRWLTFVIGSILIFLFLSLCAVIIATTFSREISLPNTEDETITPTFTAIATPQVLLDKISNEKINFENFMANYRNWGLYYGVGKVEVINQKMIFQSTVEDMAVASNENFINTRTTYYLQADLITDTVDREQQYGLVFGLNSSENSYYLFEISPTYELFRLFKYAISSDYQVSTRFQSAHSWVLLMDYTDAEMNQYPQENVLGVYFQKGNIELFINGNQVGTYFDEKPLQFSGVGVYINNYGYRLLVDNFFGYSE